MINTNHIYCDGIEVDKASGHYCQGLEKYFSMADGSGQFYSDKLILKDLKKARRNYRKWINEIYLKEGYENFCYCKHSNLYFDYSSDGYNLIGIDGFTDINKPAIIIDFGEYKRVLDLNQLIHAMEILGWKEARMMVTNNFKHTCRRKEDGCSRVPYLVEGNKEFNLNDDLCVLCGFYEEYVEQYL